MSKSKSKTTIDYCGYKPNQKVDQLYFRDGIGYWVGTYFVFDPDLEINTSKGLMKRKLKQHQIKRLNDHIPVCNKIDGKPIVVHKDRIRPHKKDAHSFADIFGTINSGGIILAGISYDQAEDLTLAGDSFESQDQLDN